MIKNLSIISEFKSLKKTSVHKLINFLMKELNFQIESLQINFVDSLTIKKINRDYLNHNYSTDIISFNYSGDNEILDGEIFISVCDAEFNAKKYKESLNKELNRLVIHGILHLIGYDDKKISEKKIMKTLENRLTYKNNFTLL